MVNDAQYFFCGLRSNTPYNVTVEVVGTNGDNLGTSQQIFTHPVVLYIVLLNGSFLASCIISVAAFNAHCNPVISRMVTITVEVTEVICYEPNVPYTHM